MFACVAGGIALGQWLPGPVQAIGGMETAKVNLPLGGLIRGGMPMLRQVDCGALHQRRQHGRSMGVPLFVNGAVKPFSRALLGWIFIRPVFAPIGALLLATLVLLFASQGEAILQPPLVIAMLAVPILIPVLFKYGLAYWLNRRLGESHSVAYPSALIGASNFFELAVAATVSLFGFESGAARATVVGVLIEVAGMLLVVRVVNQRKGG